MTFNSHVERAHCKPWGLRAAATRPAMRWRYGSTASGRLDFPNAKVLVAHLKAGDAFRMRSGGGGGHGSPLERPIADVQEDVRQGYVTVEAAAGILRRGY